MPDFSFENMHEGLVAGIDEAGRGPWAGPVVAAAVILDRNATPKGINDSKKLSASTRQKLFNEIISQSKVGVGIVDNITIDNINILNATKLAMRKALENLPVKTNFVLVDGNQLPELGVEARTIVGGDRISLSVAAASIVAKVTRDRIMSELHKKYPHFCWDRNSGYGTRQHVEALHMFGPCEFHRKSYAPIRNLLLQPELL